MVLEDNPFLVVNAVKLSSCCPEANNGAKKSKKHTQPNNCFDTMYYNWLISNIQGCNQMYYYKCLKDEYKMFKFIDHHLPEFVTDV